MRHLYIIVEGETELEFVNRMLIPYLVNGGLKTHIQGLPIDMKGGGHGFNNIEHFKKTIRPLLYNENVPFITTMIDHYGINSERKLPNYYNFEFNCIGTKLLAAGHSRHNREFANAAILDEIIVESSLERAVFEEKIGSFNWQLKAIIPIKSFFKHKIHALDGKVCRANFYKCGDGLTTPHYLSWTPIETEKPDFHTPQYFGEIEFDK